MIRPPCSGPHLDGVIQGLSIYLFVFAFLGNSFYVASILTSPKLGLPEPQASAFIKESIPYVESYCSALQFPDEGGLSS